MSAAIVWFRRDLRLRDHSALRAAAAHHDATIPFFNYSPRKDRTWPVGAASRWWLHYSLTCLSEALSKHGLALIIRQGDVIENVGDILGATGAVAVYWNEGDEPGERADSQSLSAALRRNGIACHVFYNDGLTTPHALKTSQGGPYRVFTPFWRNLSAELAPHPPQPVPTLTAHPLALRSVTLDELELLPKPRWDTGLARSWTPGEDGAWSRLHTFVHESLSRYGIQRDQPALAGTSRLSPHLHFGEISANAVAWTVRQCDLSGSAPDFIRQLAWREFAHYVLYHFPQTSDQPMDARFQNFPWRSNYAVELKCWQRGMTGIPIIDAGMRELRHTGWMHNRVRMIVASFLTKNLLVPWIEGARWFWDTLVDADLANNSMGWQWVAGCGVDAAPYFRIFNPVTQGKKFDPQGVYIKRWIPELNAVAPAFIHEPWKEHHAGEAARYPKPLTDLAASRLAALAAHAQTRNTPGRR